MEPISISKVLNMILDFIYTLSNFVYNAIFYEVTFLNNTFPLWQIFAVVGVGIVIVAIIIKIIL